MMPYAGKTKVGIESSQTEIRKIVNRYGATRFASMDEPGLSIIMFEVNGRRVKFSLTMPDISEFALTPGRRAKRSKESQYDAWEQACKARWRSLALSIKAKLVAVEDNIAMFEQEFLDYVVLPNGQTVGEYVRPQIQQAYLTGTMPKMLPGVGETGK
jgi:hypothetical protein